MDQKEKITTILVVHNEEKLIRRCLKSIKGLSNEIIVIHDGRCLDNSLKIASEFTDKVLEGQKYGCLEPHLIDAFYMTKNDWILRLDTDEYFSDELIDQISKLDLSTTPFKYFRAQWRGWDNDVVFEQHPYQEKIVLFNKNNIVSIGIPNYAIVSTRGEGKTLIGYLEHTPIYVHYGIRDWVSKRSKIFAINEAKLRYLDSIKVYPNDSGLIPKKIIIRNKYPILTLPFFAINAYLKSLYATRTARTVFVFKKQVVFAHAFLFSQVLLSYYMAKEKYKKQIESFKKILLKISRR